MTYRKPADIEFCAECPMFKFDSDDPTDGVKECMHREGPGIFINFKDCATKVHDECPLPIQWRVFIGKVPREYLTKVALAAGNSCLNVHIDTAESYKVETEMDDETDAMEIKEGEAAVYARKPKDMSDDEFDNIKEEFFGKFMDFSGVTFDSVLLKETK